MEQIRTNLENMEIDRVYEITEEMYGYYLGVIPPVKWPEKGYPKAVAFGFAFAEGAEPITLFTNVHTDTEDRYFAQMTRVINRF
jgi:hypothetical protein